MHEAFITVAGRMYYTQEQLFALAILMCWQVRPVVSTADKEVVILEGGPNGNPGHSLFLLQTQTPAKDVQVSPDGLNVTFTVFDTALCGTFTPEGDLRVSFLPF